MDALFLRVSASCPRRIAPLVVEPLAGLPVVRDLVVDSTPFWEGVAPHRALVYAPPECGERHGSRRGRCQTGNSSSPVSSASAVAACWTACDVVASHRSYLGPAALNRTMVLSLTRATGDGRSGCA